MAVLRSLPQWYSPKMPEDLITRWQGMRKATGLLPMAEPTALDAPGLLTLAAMDA